MNGDEFLIKKVVIEYAYNGELYRMTIPEDTRVDAILLDRPTAALLKGAQMRELDDRRAMITDGGGAALAEAWMEGRAREESERTLVSGVQEIDPDGSNWDRVGMNELVASLERIPGIVWLSGHSRTDLCLHDEDCMWYCMPERI